MDLRYLAGQLLLRTEIGQNLTILPAKIDKFLKISDSDTIAELLSFNLLSVKNLYSFDPSTNTFRLEHIDGDYLARASAVLNPLGVKFRAEFIESNLTEYGISYVGIIRIHHFSEKFDIKVPGEHSYDPACIPGDKLWVNFQQITKIIVILSMLVKACLLGSTKKFLKRLYVVVKPIISRYYQKEELFRWMYKQVKYACIYKKKPISYAEHLQKAEKRFNGHVQNYLASLELLKKGEIQEILPPPDFIKAISSENMLGKEKKDKNFELSAQKMGSNSENEDEEGVPTVHEILNNLQATKKKYESEISLSLKRVQDLLNSHSKARKTQIMVSLDKSFTSQCPIF